MFKTKVRKGYKRREKGHKEKRAAEQIKLLEEKRSKIKETVHQELRDTERVISELEVSRK